MANKVVRTRVQNRFDTLANWEASSATQLLKGEIAVVGVTVTTTENGQTVQKPAHLMKIGDGTTTSFADLPWLSATAADVYDWAKNEDPSVVKVKYNAGTESSADWKEITLADLYKKLNTEAAALDSVEQAIAGFYNTVSTTGTTGVVKTVAEDSTDPHKINVTRGQVATADIADDAVTAAKIAANAVGSSEIADGAVGTNEIAASAVTDAKVASGIAATKIQYTSDKTVKAQLDDIGTQLSNMSGTVLGNLSITPETAGAGVVQGVTLATDADGKGKTITVSYGTVATGDIADKAVTTAKIADSNVTTDKIANSAVTDAKIAGVAASKVSYGSTNVNAELERINGVIAELDSDVLSQLSVASTGSGVVQSVAQDANDKGKLNVTLGEVQTADIANGAVATAKIADSAVTDAKVASGIAATKIKYTDEDTVSSALGKHDQAIANMTGTVLGKLTVDPTSAGTGVVQGVTLTNTTDGKKISVSYGTVATGDITDGAVTTVKIADKNVTTAKIADTAVTNAKIASGVAAAKINVADNETLAARLATINDALTTINSTLSGRTRFVGEATAKPTGLTVTIKASPSNTTHTAAAGDIVFYGEAEYLCTEVTSSSATWKELGDLTRVGTLETLVGSIHASARTANKYVTHISKGTDGKLQVQTAQPVATEVLMTTSGSDTVSSVLTAHSALLADLSTPDDDKTVQGAINKKVNDLAATTPAASGTAAAFVDSVALADGTFTITKKNIRSASTNQTGIVQLDDSTSSTSTTKAATGRAAAAAYSLANTANATATAIKASYLKCEATGANTSANAGSLLAVEGETTYTIIFDCGGATL